MVIADLDTARRRLAKLVNADEGSAPLSDDDLIEILTDNGPGTPWAAETAYTAGAILTVGQRRFRVAQAGTSGTTAPTWPTARYVGVIGDGTVYWADAGPARGGYDLTGAQGDAWHLKAVRVAHLIDFADKDAKIPLTQERDAYTRMSARFPKAVFR